MRFLDQFKFSYGALKTQKIRSGLTILGVIIGITAIVSLLALGAGFETSMTSQLQSGLSTKTLTVNVGGGFGFISGSSSDSDIVLYVNDSNILESIEHVELATGLIQKTVEIEITGNSTPVIVYGVDFEKYSQLYSTFITETGDISTNASSPEFVIGRSVQDPWDNGTTLVDVDDTLIITWTVRNGTMWEEYNYTSSVAGVLSEIGGTSFLGGPSDTAIYLPIKTASEIFETEEVNSLTILLDDDSEETINTVTEAIEEIFGDQINVLSATATLETLSGTLGTMQVFLAAIAGISLFVAGIGIMNIMIVSLLQRTREIGVLKALGMKDRSILSIFLFETLWIGLIGSALGIILGWVLSNVFGLVLGNMMTGGVGGGGGAVNRITGAGFAITPVLTSDLIIQALFFGVLVAVVFGIYPAWRASRLEPVEALRYE